LKQAYEEGNTDAIIAAQDKLAEIKAEKKLAENQKKQPKQKPQTQDRMPRSAYEAGQEEVREGNMSQEDLHLLSAWESEKDDGGKLLRPWAHGGHPDYEAAYMEAAVVFNSGKFAHLSTEQKLSEVDKRLGLQKRTSQQNVMGGGLTQTRKTNKVALTPKQQEIAIKSRYGGAGKSDAEHLEAYRKQIEKVQSKGSR
jgi:hypothetical protein